jgi:hypothetical protein
VVKIRMRKAKHRKVRNACAILVVKSEVKAVFGTCRGK